MDRRNNQRGAITGIVAATGIFLVVIGVALIQILLIVQGSNEVRNAVDAGGLNVARRAQEVLVRPQGFDELQFADVLDKNGSVGLTNINRVWAKALLVQLNAREIGNAAESHGNAVYQGAKALNDRLSDKLNDQKNLYGYFRASAQGNSARMLGTESQVKEVPGNNWRTSYLDREMETNIEFKSEQFPASGDEKTVGKVSVKGKNYIPGYKPIDVQGKTIVFTPFRQEDVPHLVSGSAFDANQVTARPISGFQKPVPNAYSSYGANVAGSQSSPVVASIAHALANPQKSFKLAIPNGFIRIRLKEHKARVTANANSTEQTYTPGVPSTIFLSSAAGAGTLNTTNVVGNEYIPPTLFQAIYGLAGNHDRVTKLLLQRIREIKQDFNAGDLTRVLQSAPIVPGVDEYYIYPIYVSNNEEPQIIAGTAAQVRASAPWLNTSAQAEGTEQVVATEFSSGGPDVLVPILVGTGVPVYGPQFVLQNGTQTWKAGSGYNGVLGELSIQKDATIFSSGTVIPPV